MPKARAIRLGESTSAVPRAMLNQPRPRASRSVPSARREDRDSYRVRVAMTSSSHVDRDLDAAVALVAEGLVHGRRVLERDAMRDHERRIDLAVVDATQQI